MKRSLKEINIKETESELKELIRKSKDPREKERLDFVLWLKTGRVKSLKQAAELLSRHRNTLTDWLARYERAGLSELLDRQVPGGPKGPLDDLQLAMLKERLSHPQGFNSYWDIQIWIKEHFELELSYKQVFRVCHDKLGASPKVPRPQNPLQDKELLEDFKKTSDSCLKRQKKSTQTIKL